MKFLFNSSCYKPAYRQGGPVYSVSALAEGLVKRGHHVTVMAPNLDLGEKMPVPLGVDHCIEGVSVRFFDAKPTLLQRAPVGYFRNSGVFSFGPEAAEWLKGIGRDIDVFHSQIAFLSTNVAVSHFARRNDRIYLYSQRGNLDAVRLKHGWLKKRIYLELVERPVMRRADVLLALTPHERVSYRRWARRGKCVIIPNGVDIASLDRRVRSASAEVASTIARCEQDVVFLWMSRIHPSKGPDVLVEAAIAALEGGSRFHLILAGPDEVGMESRLKVRVRDACLGRRIHFVGAVQGDDKLALLQRADCFMLPTISEGFSVVLLEALACNCAVVTSPGAHFCELRDAGAGEVVDRAVESYARMMAEYASGGRAELERMGRRGRALVEKRYTWDGVVDRYLSIIDDLLRGARSSCT